VSVGDKYLAVRCDHHAGWAIERVFGIAGHTWLPKLHEDLAFGGKLEDLVSLAIFCVGIRRPHVVSAIYKDPVWEHEHA
jgi:hypothetical protein